MEDDILTDLIMSLFSSVHGMHSTRLAERGPQQSMHVHEKSNLVEPEPRFIRMAQRNIFKGYTASWALWSLPATRQILRDLIRLVRPDDSDEAPAPVATSDPMVQVE